MHMHGSVMCYSVLVVGDIGTILSSRIMHHPHLKLLAEVDSYEAGYRQLNDDRPDVMLVDLDLPVGDSVALIREPQFRTYATRTMAISRHVEEEYVIPVIEAGAASYLCTRDSLNDIAELIVRLAQGDCPLSPSIAPHLLKYFHSNPNAVNLSEKEKEILLHLIKGASFKVIARALAISPYTVDTHVKHIYQKLEVHSRGEAVFKAIQLGLIKEAYRIWEKETPLPSRM